MIFVVAGVEFGRLAGVVSFRADDGGQGVIERCLGVVAVSSKAFVLFE